VKHCYNIKIFVFSIILLTTTSVVSAQSIAGNYKVRGYIFHPVNSRSFTILKTISQVAPNVYKITLADLASSNYTAQFSIDSNNNLVNWVATGATPVGPASGFMTADNPGNINYTGSSKPGTPPWVHSMYNNKYYPSLGVFYMHYGYGSGATSQNGYDRQIYEKWELPRLFSSITPMTGTTGSQITIKGRNFIPKNRGRDLRFGGSLADTVVILSDSLMIATLGSAGSGSIILENPIEADTILGFVYNHPPAVTDPQWVYVGNAGFSDTRVENVKATIDSQNVIHVMYTDSLSQVIVKKQVGNTWIQEGPVVSNYFSKTNNIAIDTAGRPVVSFSDPWSAKIRVKRLVNSAWVDLSLPVASGNSWGSSAITIDSHNTIYVASIDYSKLVVFKSSDTGWISYRNLAICEGNFDISVDRTTNTPYVVFQDQSQANQLRVKKLIGSSWVDVGPPVTSSSNGAWYPKIRIDKHGNPIVGCQDDDGFERISVFKFIGGNWQTIGNRFSKARAYSLSMALGKNGQPYFSYLDESYNYGGTVMTMDKPHKATILGKRGFVKNSFLYTPHDEIASLNIDLQETPVIAFSDFTNGRRASVMKLNIGCYNTTNRWTGSISSDWNNPGNWACGTVPVATTDVVIHENAIIVLSSNTTINTLTIHPGASLTVAAGVLLTIRNQ
jgi:hypothetical protein